MEVPFNDNSIMPFGMHRGKKMANVPAKYLLYILENNMCYDQRVKNYILENQSVLKQEIKRGTTYQRYY